MGNYTNLKNLIDQYITTNGQGDITGAILNDVLKSIVDSIGADFLFAGVAEPDTNPGSPDQNVFFIAIKGGSYTNFGNVVIPNGISIFMWNGSWSYQILFAGDGGVFDITAYHNNTKYADLTAALGTNGANVPQSLQKGGMSVKFVRSSDNKYVQYFLTKDEWSLSEADWQKMNLEEEVSQLGQEVNGLSLSSGISSFEPHPGWMNASGEVALFATALHYIIPISEGQVYEIYPPAQNSAVIAFLKSYSEPTADGQLYDIIGSRIVFSGVQRQNGIVPENAKFLWVGLTSDGIMLQVPQSILIGGVQYKTQLSDVVSLNREYLRDAKLLLSETIIGKDWLQKGCFQSGTFTRLTYRVGVIFPIPVKKGEQVICKSYDYRYHPVLRDAPNGNIINNWGEIYYPVSMPQDGFLYLYICKPNEGDISVDEANGLLSIQRISPEVEFIPSSWLVKGYINSSHEIATHSTRFVNFRRVAVKKGDLIYADNLNLSFVASEYSNTGDFLTKSSEYNASIPTPFGQSWICAPYVVQNDGYVMLQCADITDPESINLDDYNNGICVIHIPRNKYDLISNGIRKVTPISPKRGAILPLDNAVGRYIQNGTMVGDKLYVQTDGYGGNDKNINVVNIESGVVEKTIPFTWEKHGGISYNANRDILIVSNGGKLMFFKNPRFLDGTLSENDADIVITTAFTYGVIAWGEDDYTIYWVRGYDGTNASTKRFFQVDKLRLGVSNGEYTGTFTIINSFSGVINDGIDTYQGEAKGGNNYAQDAEYDGYLYVAFGGMSQNYLVLNLNEWTNTFEVVGNYWWRYLDGSGVEHYLETELVTLFGSKIICGARNYSENISSIRIFERT